MRSSFHSFGALSLLSCSDVPLSNEDKVIAEGLKGHTPTFQKLATMVLGFIALYHAFEKRDEKENFVETFPGFSAINVWQTLDQCFFLVAQKTHIKRLCSVCCMWRKAHYCLAAK